METSEQERRKGLLNGVAAHVMWGVMPLYFHALKRLCADQILAYRICWTSIILVGVISWMRAWPTLAEGVRTRRTLLLLLGSALLLGTNWLVFIYSVQIDQVRFASLGYFVNPLVNVLLGLVFFRERLRVGQWSALAIATAGLAFLVVSLGQLPWITLTLAGSFGLYGMFRKLNPMESLPALTVESFVLVLPAVGYVIWGLGFPSLLGPSDTPTNLLLMLSGLITIGPLFCFGVAASRLPLSVLGFLQYIGPSLQLLVSLIFFGERISTGLLVCFLCTWTALLVLTGEALYVHRQEQRRLDLSTEQADRAEPTDTVIESGLTR